MIGVVTRSLTMQETAEKACKRLDIKGLAIECPYAEIGMDVDKPHQLEIMRTSLTR
jgi:hypothetical protein